MTYLSNNLYVVVVVLYYSKTLSSAVRIRESISNQPVINLEIKSKPMAAVEFRPRKYKPIELVPIVQNSFRRKDHSKRRRTMSEVLGRDINLNQRREDTSSNRTERVEYLVDLEEYENGYDFFQSMLSGP